MHVAQCPVSVRFIAGVDVGNPVMVEDNRHLFMKIGNFALP